MHGRAHSTASKTPITHGYAAPLMESYTATVTVRLKRGVRDPEAETTRRALERLGFDLDGLRAADRFEVDLEAADADAARERAGEMAERLLANPTIHDYDVEVRARDEEGAGPGSAAGSSA